MVVLAIRAVGASLVWEQHEGYRLTPLSPSAGGKPGFTSMPATVTGVLFTNQLLPEAEVANQNLLNGAGLALGDYDNDGWCDLFLCNLNGSCALFRNLGGWKFTNVTATAGLANTNWLARGAVFADVDGDGHLDLLITRSGKGAQLFLNNGHGGFQESQQPELAAETGSTSLTLADMDSDGALDLYVANYGENTIRSGMKITTRTVGGKEQVVGRMRNRLKIIGGRLIEFGEPDVLYRNDGHGRFTRVSWTDGTFRDETGLPLTSPPWDLGLTAMFRDINQDGFPDLYVCNDFQTPDRIWLNNGRGQFQAIRREAIRLSSQFSMAVDFCDLNHDGYDDFMVSDMLSPRHRLRMRELDTPSPPTDETLERTLDRPQIHRNTLYLNRGDGTYAEIANFAGVAASDWSWTVNFIDVDLDGWEDVLIGTGHLYDALDLDAIEQVRAIPGGQRNPRQALSIHPPLRVPNIAFRNRGDLTFEEVGRAWGFDAQDVSTSLAFADLDNDGDLDVVVNCLNAPALLYRNNASAPRVAVVLRGIPPNTHGVGAKIKVLGGAVPVQRQEIICGGRYLAGDAPMRVFAAGALTNRITLEVTWRSGKQSVVSSISPNCLVEVDEAGARPHEHSSPASLSSSEARAPNRPSGVDNQTSHLPNQRSPAVSQTPLFEDQTPNLNHLFREDRFDEYARQPLLPWSLSQLGPGLAWIDLDGDGLVDLAAGGGKGTRLALFQNQGQGKFQPWPGPSPRPLVDDTTGLAAWAGAENKVTLLVGLASYESGQSNPVMHVDEEKGLVAAATPGTGKRVSAGPLAVADIDGTGSLDVFVGGRCLPGRYPEAAPSILLRSQSGRLSFDERESRAFQTAGLVSGATFTDLDGDGRPELVLACEWAPLRVFRRETGQWREVTREWGLSERSGLWNSVAAGDFDGDGRMDLVAGNLGLNSAYEQVAPGPWHLYFGDLNSDGTIQIIEAYDDAELKRTVPWRQMAFLEKALPWLRAQFPTHKAFADASLEQVLAQRLRPIHHLSINWLASTVFLNRGGHFEARPLPREAQWAPVFGIAVADFDGDGHEDLFLAQNNYAVRPEDPRLESGRGLILRGDGTGGFAAVSGTESGIAIYGEQRGCAVADYDGDGRVDLAVAEHNGPLHLFRNRGGQPGLRVQLVGPSGNPLGIGAVMWLRFGDQSSPAREIHAGNGYWSQDSAGLVLATPTAPAFLDIRWPGGKRTESPIPPGAKSIQISAEGRLKAEE